MTEAIVLDTSAVLALLYAEPGSGVVAEATEDPEKALYLSTINLAEVVSKLVKQGATDAQVASSVAYFAGYVVDFDSGQAIHAGRLLQWTEPYGLSLGDRACLALAAKLKATAWTTDAAWTELDVGIRVRLIRMRD